MKNSIKNNIQRYIAVIFMLCILLSSCESDDERTPLIITSISITEGFFGDEMVIEGTGFSATATENLVSFSGVTAEVTSSTTTSITTKVPFPAPTGSVTVTTNNEQAPGPVFTLILPPAEVIGFSSFEEVPSFIGDVTYPKSGTVDLPNIQLSDPDADDPYVDFTATGDELGFDTSFIASDIGDDGSEAIGVLSNENMDDDGDSDFTGRWQDGTQGFLGADLDGTLEIVFDQISLDASNITAVTLEADIFLADSSSGFEEGDQVSVYYMVDGVLGLPLITYDHTSTLNTWFNASVQIPLDQIAPGNIVIQMRTNSNSETIYVDRVAVKGVTVNL